MILIAAILSGLMTMPAPAARAQDEPYSCWSARPAPTATKSLAGGFVVTFGPTPRSQDPERACEVEVRDAQKRVLYRADGFNTRLHPESGQDVDNDGQPDLIVGADTGGGNRCCWEYAAIAFTPKPHVIATFPDAVAFEKGRGGRTIVWQTEAFYDLGPNMAESPIVNTAAQFRSGRMVDVTAEYCDAMLGNQLKGWADMHFVFEALTPAAMRASHAASTREVAYEIQQTRNSAMILVLQSLYCGRNEIAADTIRDVWPADEQTATRARFKAAFVGRWPEIGKRLDKW